MALPKGTLNLQEEIRALEERVSNLESVCYQKPAETPAQPEDGSKEPEKSLTDEKPAC